MSRRTEKEQSNNVSIRSMTFGYFTFSALVIVLLVGVSLFQRIRSQYTTMIQEENQAMISLVDQSMNTYLGTIMKLSDSIYYSAIKNADLSDHLVNEKLTLLYDTNKGYISNIALLSRTGELLEAVPAARLKSGLDVTEEAWFQETLDRADMLHFSMPHVQYIFDLNENQYRWVITLTRAVEITQGTATHQGVLLIDMAYTSFQQMMDNVNLGNEGYLYIINSRGELIYHPKIQLIDAGMEEENNLAAAAYRDGNYVETWQGRKRNITVKSVGYTGWKIIGVTPEQGLALNNLKTRLFVLFIFLFFLFLLTLINYFISSRITVPIQQLEKSVNALEAGELDTEIYCGGSYEIQHLGRSIGDMAKRIQTLMQDIVAEHESKRKSEFETLQSQINPHFLYNTLDIIVWMIENEQKQEAVKVVTALARFFRISLSRGKNIIPVRDELEHVRSYLMIQQMRFKNKFTFVIDAGPETLECASLKLMLQPLVENAIYHGMEFMDGDGEILVAVRREGERLRFEIRDNGLGMTPEQAASLLTDKPHQPSVRGSGIGVRNVNDRIRLYFGDEYGLVIASEPDEGTVVTIWLPAVSYDQMMEKERV